MSRAERLLALLQALRRRRRPVSAAVLAEELAASPRTIYRDIATLRAQGAAIEGEAGIGYVLRPGDALPPLMFGAAEIEALVLGCRWVMRRTDESLAAAAHDALAKIAAVLPAALREDAEFTGLLVGPRDEPPARHVDLAPIRTAIRAERKLRLTYRDAGDAATERIVWPIALAFFDHVRVLAAWCEMREGFRHFRSDRIVAVADTGERYPTRRRALMAAWRAAEHIPEQY
jgi:predicted DNA-binding transcriptional regulator YafY